MHYRTVYAGRLISCYYL